MKIINVSGGKNSTAKSGKNTVSKSLQSAVTNPFSGMCLTNPLSGETERVKEDTDCRLVKDTKGGAVTS